MNNADSKNRNQITKNNCLEENPLFDSSPLLDLYSGVVSSKIVYTSLASGRERAISNRVHLLRKEIQFI